MNHSDDKKTSTNANVSSLLQNFGNDEVTLELGNMVASEIDSKTDQIKKALVSLTLSPTKSLVIHADAMTRKQAEIILKYLQEPLLKLCTVEITLPAHLEQTKIQIELDNLISNHYLEKNKQQIAGSDSSSAQFCPEVNKQAPQGRVRTKKIKPKIEITLHEESTQVSIQDEVPVIRRKPPSSTVIEPPKLERSPMAADIITRILNQKIFASKKKIWEQMTNRSEAKAFRKNILEMRSKQIENHPIHSFILDNEMLQNKLSLWTQRLKLNVKHYDALMDVIGQYDTAGLEVLFKTWEYDTDPYKATAFEETHAILLKYMPSYLPFIQDSAMNETISKIANLSAEKRSWWLALIKNHVEITNRYTDLPYLFKVFTEASVLIEEMGLPFYHTDTIKDKADLPTTLLNIIALLKKCPEHDRDIQWKCMNKVNISEQTNMHFIIPEMKLEEEHPDLSAINTTIKSNPEMEPNNIIPAFYRYLATQKQHLPLKKYKQILNEIFSNTKLTNQNKLRMVYVLAKTTSTDKDAGFDPEQVYNEWNNFQIRTTDLEYMERIKANRSALARFAFTQGIEARGGYTAVRNKVLTPIMNMASTPPMSYLNKLLTLSEYKFLDPDLNLISMESTQNMMLIKMEQAAALYAEYPDLMNKAIRLIKTETVKKNSQGQFFPDPNDVSLLEQFLNASTILVEGKHNKFDEEKHNPRQVLLPLLTIFHLEYESKEKLEGVIQRYKERITASDKPEYKEVIQNLLPYGLSLLGLIKNRESPKRLDYNILDKIQNELLKKLCTPHPVSQKQVREWLHQNYGEYFDGNILLDIKDDINFDTLFDSQECYDSKIRQGIKTLVSNFDADEEKDHHTKLVLDLIKLTNQLTPEQSAQFFEYCKDALKTDGILSRAKQDAPPSFIQQFISLVHSLTLRKNITELEQFLIIAREHKLRGGEQRNSLIKCDYLITTLYPKLLDKKIERKEAFNFAANLVCQSPLQAVISSHDQVNYLSSIDLQCKELNELQEQIQFFYSIDSTPNSLLAIRKKIEALIALAPDDRSYFNQCRKTIAIIDKINAEIEKRTAEHNSRNFIIKALLATINRNLYSPKISEKELLSLTRISLRTLADDTQNDIQRLKIKMNTRFQDLVAHLHDKKEELINKYPNITTRANDFILKALSLSPDNISKNHNEVCQLIDDLIALDDQNLVLSLMYHYAGGLADRGIKDLVALFNTVDYQSLNNTIKKDFINVIVSQMNNNVPCGSEEIRTFLSFICRNKEKQILINSMHDFYQEAPYPSLEKFMLWTENAENQDDIDQAYEKYDKNPCALDGHEGREKENGFKLLEAHRILAKMTDVTELFTKEYLEEIDAQAKEVKILSTKVILQELKKFKDIPYKNHIRLVMLTAELLHRSKGRTPEFFAKVQIPGRSFELNTTQIMAILAMLETPGKKVTAEIGTGEGKTRILMIINACQFLKGNTVDFLTSNLALAQRDYLSSLPFFKSLGAEINFITASSKIENYKIKGINVSDPANLFLFRKKGCMQNNSNLVLDPNEEKRTLTLDEADVTFFDVSNTKYNFSSNTPKINIALIPLYPLLMEFFAQAETEKTYLENKKRCNQQLLDFIEARNPDLFNHVKTVTAEQLEKWQDAAYSARHLEYNIDYSVVTETSISTELGSKKVASAMCLIGSRVNEHAKFAEGVHACLHAELNRLMKAPDSEIINPYLKEILNRCKSKEHQFPIEPQRQITSTTSANNMLKHYDKGNLMAVTGTVGSDLEKREAKAHFKTKFIHVPRHKGMHRFDRPIIICNDGTNYLDAFITSIAQACAKNEPTLILCKDDNQSRELYDALKNHLASIKNINSLPKIRRIHAATDYEDGISEADYIKNEAGQPGQVTISTEMQGRGVDITPGPEGLRVLHAYLPKEERDYIQGIGRSGRFGQIGTTQMILTINSLKEDFGIDHLNTDFYLNPDAFIRRLQIFSTITKKLHRLFYKSLDDLLGVYTQEYEQHLIKDEDSSKAWSKFIEQISISQENTQQAIEAQIHHKKPDINEIEKQLAAHCKRAKELWHTFIQSLPAEKKDLVKNNLAPELKKPKELDGWLKSMQELQARNQYKVEVLEKRKVKIHEYYSQVNEGRANVLKYPGSFVPNFVNWWYGEGTLFPNLQAWRQGDLDFGDVFGRLPNWQTFLKGEGLLFPNLRAWLSGNMSFRNMVSQWPIFRYFITPVEETHEVKITIPSTYAFFYNNHSELIEKEDSLSDEENQYTAPEHHESLIKKGTDALVIVEEIKETMGRRI